MYPPAYMPHLTALVVSDGASQAPSSTWTSVPAATAAQVTAGHHTGFTDTAGRESEGMGSLWKNDRLQQIAANRFSTPQDFIAILLQGFVRHPHLTAMRSRFYGSMDGPQNHNSPDDLSRGPRSRLFSPA